MKFFVYFDAYGHARRVVNQEQLAQTYHNDPDEFLRAMCRQRSGEAFNPTTGHVGILSFDNEQELADYLESLGDEITGFYGCHSQSRPYNF
ncbi:MAG: hypothetical protein JSU83_10820 [Deltaproteobacteria bacterium]|nr:MAG: hypothetical protein JSU83_10820 [Deltaproteobacteria bacterium]